MFRWAVDTTGIDIDADLMREQEPVSVRRTSRTPVSTTEWGKAKAELKSITDASHRTLGEVHILQRHELLDEFQQKAERAVLLSGNVPPSITRPNTSSTVEDGDSDVNVTEESGKDLRIFTTFLSSTSKLTAVNVTMKQQSYKGLDIVAAFLQQAVAVDERVNQRFSLNPRLYKLFIADEFTGEDEMPVQLDSVALDFSHYAVHPLPAAKLFLFPQRQELLPMVTNDIDLTVNVRPSDPQGKVIQRRCCVPADLLAESLENVITRRLPASGIVAGSLRIMYGPLELNINESYNFGAGCGQMSCPIAERTVLSLIRFGVTEVVVSGRCVEEFSGASFADVEDIVVEMDVEQALSFQQFEVIFINAYGARQQRFLCIDGEHLYTMRPYSVATDSVPKMRERMIKDIEEVKLYPNKPKYMEIIYCAESRFEEDHFECTTPYNCAVVDEKIRLLRRELRKREAESTPEEAPVGVVKRFLHGFKLGLFT